MLRHKITQANMQIGGANKEQTEKLAA